MTVLCNTLWMWQAQTRLTLTVRQALVLTEPGPKGAGTSEVCLNSASELSRTDCLRSGSPCLET